MGMIFIVTKDIDTLMAIGVQSVIVNVLICIALIYSAITGCFSTGTQITIIFLLLIQSQVVILVKLLIDREEKHHEN